MEYLIGVDGGGTKTNAVVAKSNGEIVCGVQSGVSNFQRVGSEGINEVCQDILNQLEQKKKIKSNQIKYWALGLAGAGRIEDQNAVCQTVESLGFQECVSAQSDAYIALMGAFSGRSGIIVIAGTGSICFGLDEEGNLHRSGGWGYLLGDEGSGFFVGHQGLLAALKDLDDRGEKTILRERIEQAFNLSSIDQVVRKMYIENKIQKEDIANLAPIVFECMHEGDEVANSIVTKTSRKIAKMITAVGKKMNKIEKSIEVAYIGSVFKQKDVLLPPIRIQLQNYFTDVEINEPRFEPAIGAVIWALKEKNIQIDETILKNLEQNYEMI